jgi:hypothetical protein
MIHAKRPLGSVTRLSPQTRFPCRRDAGRQAGAEALFTTSGMGKRAAR